MEMCNYEYFYNVRVLDSNNEEVMSTELEEDISNQYQLYLALCNGFLNTDCMIQFVRVVYQNGHYVQTEIDEYRKGE